MEAIALRLDRLRFKKPWTQEDARTFWQRHETKILAERDSAPTTDKHTIKIQG
jgi:hypothetical protein